MIRTPALPPRLHVRGDNLYWTGGVRLELVASIERDLDDCWLAVDRHGQTIAGPFPARARALDAARTYAEEARP